MVARESQAEEALKFVGGSDFQTSRQSVHEEGEVVSPRQRPPLRPRKCPCWKLSVPQGRSAAETIMSIKKSNNTIRNRNHDIHASSAVPQLTVPPRVPNNKNFEHVCLS